MKNLTFYYCDSKFCYSSEKLKKLFGKRKSISWRGILSLNIPLGDRLLAISHYLVPYTDCGSIYVCKHGEPKPEDCPSRIICKYIDNPVSLSKIKRHMESLERRLKKQKTSKKKKEV